jgi:hypothetical protein
MDEPQALTPESNIASTIPSQDYRGNKYDLYALVAGTLGGTVIAMCASGNLLWYCLPIAPLVLGIVALRNYRTSLDPQRTRNLAWLGIAGGGLGTLLLVCIIVFFALYFSAIIAVIIASISQSAPRR